MCYLRVVRPRPRRSPDCGLVTWSGSQDTIDDRNDSRRGDRNRPLAIRTCHPFLGEEPRVHVAAAVRAGSHEVLLTFGLFLDNELVRGPVDYAFDESIIERLSQELLRLEPRLSDPLVHYVHLDSPLGLRAVGKFDDHRFASPLHPAAPESGQRTSPRRQPFSGGANASDGAAALPPAGSRMNRTPVAEIPMNVSAMTANAREPTASVRAPPRIGPMIRPVPKMIE